MNILYLDSSTEACTAGVAVDGRTVSAFEVAPRGHARLLLPMAEDLLSSAGIGFADLDLVGFGRGPGSFTGVRIATAMAQGIAIARDLPLVPVSSLECLAVGARERFRSESGAGHGTAGIEIRVAIDARMGEIYRASYLAADEATIEPILAEAVVEPGFPSPELDRVIAAGSGFGRYPELLDIPGLLAGYDDALPHAEDALRLVAATDREAWIAPDEAVPHYLRDNVTGP
ncbi:tRNA (adenosine(37)-N6)-threonylcarbamoyltransferase complex dimerization subunit type 1 TsaB [Guyparkeria sp.]|uniref:tRNA (adenosine(37)-N6)-threonylcarbamoyltransferase complex dimerization subunit type 1 TsaB n=1 Tax=Guyparkeria sp. TaxID=2035736 RepID=UPI003566663B